MKTYNLDFLVLKFEIPCLNLNYQHQSGFIHTRVKHTSVIFLNIFIFKKITDGLPIEVKALNFKF